MRRYIAFLLSLMLLGNASYVVAAETAKADSSEMSVLKGRLWKAFNRQPDAIADSPVDGLYEAVYGSKIFYVSMDAKHLISGEVYDLNTLDNLTEQRRAGSRIKLLNEIPESSMIVYKAKDEKHVVTVFTDIDCVYCRKLHSEIKETNDLGITVRYLAYPRAGVNSASYNKAVSVWCAKDRNKAMDDAKNRGKITPASCDAPVKEHLARGEQFGVSGTPALVLEDGSLQPGYAPPKQLLKLFK